MRIPWEIPALALSVAIAAASCAGAPVISGASVCPEPKLYTVDQEARAARELLVLPAGSILAEMITDYGRERAELRVCRRGF
jgi:hypothetical protein